LISLEYDWYGQPPGCPLAFSLGLQGEELTFRFQAAKAPEADLSLACGTFLAGLWQQEVAEFFIRKGSGPAYQEFNLSPSGAWWSALFSGYREQVREVPCPTAKTRAHWSDRGWEAELSVSLQDLIVLEGSWQNARIKVTAILHTQNPRYFCYGYGCAGEPDFHLENPYHPLETLT